MSDRPAPPPIDLGEPEAVITKTGRFWYSVSIHQDLTQTGPWLRPTRRSAESKARRELVKYRKPSPPSWTVKL